MDILNNVINFQPIMPSASQIIAELQDLLDEAIAIDQADMGTIHLYDAQTETLRIVVHKELNAEFLEYFNVVKPFDSSACGRAAGIGNIVVISDVMHDVAFTPHRPIAKRAGFRSVKSVPLLAGGKLLGVLSIHFKTVQWSWQIGVLNTQIDKITQLLENSSNVKLIDTGSN